MKPKTEKIRACLSEFGVTSEMLDEASNELRIIEERCIDQSAIPKSVRDHINARYPLNDETLANLLGVKRLLKGVIKVKNESHLIFRGLTLQVLGLFYEIDGKKYYAVSLLGTPFAEEKERELFTHIGPEDIESMSIRTWSVNDVA